MSGTRSVETPGARPPRVIGVVSGKGGVGKSHLSANLAVYAARSGLRTLVVDADAGLANVDILYGLKPRYHLGHLLEGALTLEQALADGPEGVKVLPASSGVQALTQLDDAQKLKLVSALDGLGASFDVVIVDAAAGIGDNVLFFVGAAHEALVVVNPEPTALSDAYAAVKTLALEAGVTLFNVVVNPAANEAVAQDVFQMLSGVASRFLDVQVRFVGWLPRDENVHRAAMAQKPLLLSYPNSPASRALSQVACALLDAPPPAHVGGGLKFLWARLFEPAPGAGA